MPLLPHRCLGRRARRVGEHHPSLGEDGEDPQRALPAEHVHLHRQNYPGSRLYTAPMIDAAVKAFASRGLLDANRIEWKNHHDLTIELHETSTRITRGNCLMATTARRRRVTGRDFVEENDEEETATTPPAAASVPSLRSSRRSPSTRTNRTPMTPRKTSLPTSLLQEALTPCQRRA